MKNIIIMGGSGHAKTIIDIVERENRHRIVGVLDPALHVGERLLGHPVLGGDGELPELVKRYGIEGAILAIGENHQRAVLAERLAIRHPDLPLVSAVHPGAAIGKGTTLGEGTVVMAGAVIGPDCRVGRLCVVNTLASLDHDSFLEDFASLAPHAATGGNCRIGRGAFLGMGAVVIHGIRVGEHALLGAGAVAVRDVAALTLSLGVPARVVRFRRADEPGWHAGPGHSEAGSG
ncbi:MAG: acetyltransferase [Magnetococcales bacterium]|nr:acetyltransferase [Magnetococcales bacterium]